MSTPTVEYGTALYTLSKEENLESEILGDVRAILPIFEQNPDFINLLTVPSVPKEERIGLIDKAFGNNVHKYLVSFLKLLVKRDKAKIIPDCLKEYEKLWYKYSGIAVAEVRTAVPLSETQKKKLLSVLEKKTGRDVEMHTVIDKSVIAGVSVSIDGKLIEDSMRRRIDTVKQKLSEKTL